MSSPDQLNTKESATIYPNPFNTSISIVINDPSYINNAEVIIYNVLGAAVMNTRVTKKLTALETNSLPSGIYFYKIISNKKTIQSGKLISQQ